MRFSVCANLAALLLIGVLFATGCSSQSFVGQRVDNFSAYYNTFYNAQRAYDEATESLADAQTPIDQSAYLPVFPAPEQAGSGEALEKTIEKSADLLRDHPNSKWVDDALMLIGQSYFYQENFFGAEQKFREVTARGGAKEEEARFWLGRTLVEAGKEADAEALLRETLAEGEDRWTARLWLVQGALGVRQEDWAAAAEALTRGLEAGAKDDRLQARASFLLGQVYETMEQPGEAAAAYAQAADEADAYELRYAARTGAIRARAAAGAPDEALRALRDMERDDKNRDYARELALLRGHILVQKDQPSAARRVYTDVLYSDPRALDAGLSAEVRGQAHYALGMLFRDEYGAYVRAAAHFDTAATALGTPALAEDGARLPRTPAAVTDAREQAASFGRLASARRTVSRLDSLLRLGRMSESEFDAFADDLRRRLAREQAAAQRAQQARAQQQQQGFGAADGFEQEPGAFGGAAIGDSGATEAAASQAAGGEAGFLFHRDRTRALQNRERFIERWGRRPRVPNWRRVSAISGASGTRTAGSPTEQAGTGAPDLAQPDGIVLPALDLSDVPRTPAAQEQMEADRAVARYELANAFFLSAGRPDSALVWYHRVIGEDGDQPVARRAHYALAEAQQAAGDAAAARDGYRTVIRRYPGTDLARRAQERLDETARTGGQPGGEAEAGSDPASGAPAARAAGGASPEQAAQAERAYERAYAQWQGQQYAEAVRGMVETAAAYQGTDVAPRALLAAGSASLEWARRDTFALGAPLPVTLPDSLTRTGGLLDVTDAPTSEAASAPTDSAPTARPDSARTPAADTLAAPPVRSEPALADSAARSAPPRARAADTTGGAPDRTAMQTADALVADSLIGVVGLRFGGEPPGVRPRTLLASVVTHYGQTPYAERARRMLQALDERVPPRPGALGTAAAARSETSERERAGESEAEEGTPPRSPYAQRPPQVVAQGRTPDSTQQAPGRPAPGRRSPADRPQMADGASGARDSLRSAAARPSETQAADTSAAEADAAAEATAVVDEEETSEEEVSPPPGRSDDLRPLRRAPAPSWARGAWVIVAESRASGDAAVDEARALRSALGETEYRLGIMRASVDGQTYFRVIAGPFASQQSALDALRETPDFSEGAWVTRPE